jgi:hypothetical protein
MRNTPFTSRTRIITMKEDETTTVVASTTTTSSDKSFDSVVVHPLVLLSVVDHYKRVDEVRARFFFSPMRSLRVFSLFGFSMMRSLLRGQKSDWLCARSSAIVVSRFSFSLAFARLSLKLTSLVFFLSHFKRAMKTTTTTTTTKTSTRDASSAFYSGPRPTTG